MSFDDTKRHSNLHFKRGMYSSLRVKNRTQRSSFDGLFESRWSLYSGNSLSTDDFNWSLQPSYLKMMNDTNLIDNCAKAREEIESSGVPASMRQLQFLDTNKSRSQRTTVDAEQMLQWIVYMEKYLKAFSPNWREVNEMDEHERNVSFSEMVQLRQYIASHNRIFNQMMKEEDSLRTKNLQNKFHMLLLNAIEKQCLLEGGYPKVEDGFSTPKSYDRPHMNLDVYKLCSLDIEPQSDLDRHADTLIRSTESLDSDTGTITTSDDGINFPTHPTTSKSSLFSEDHCSPFSSHPDFEHEQSESLENILKELDNIIDAAGKTNEASATDDQQNKRKSSSSSMSVATLKLIENVDFVLPNTAVPNIDEYQRTNNKVDNWLLNHPNETTSTTSQQRNSDMTTKIVNKIGSSSSSDSDRGSTLSIQWDNFQDIYTLTAPIHEEVNNDFLFFGDDYDDALKGKRVGSISSISDIVRKSTASTLSVRTTSSISEKSWPKCGAKDKPETPKKAKIVGRKKKRVSRQSNSKNNSTIQQSSPNDESSKMATVTATIQRSSASDTSTMAKDILLIAEELRNNYANLKPQDFDGILKVCRENLGCLIVVLDKEQQHHRSMDSNGDDRIYIQENCRCGVIGQFVGQLVRFLYDCSRSVRRSTIYRFLLKLLKTLYGMVKFLSHKVRVYRSFYEYY